MSMKFGITSNPDLRTPRDKVVDGTIGAALCATRPLFDGLGKAQRILDTEKSGEKAIAVRRTDRYRLLFRGWVHYLLTNPDEKAGNPPGIDVYYGSARSPIEALKERALAALKEESPKWDKKRKSRRPMPLSFFFDFRVCLREEWKDLSPHLKHELVRFLQEQEGSDFLDFTFSTTLEQAWHSPAA